MSKVNVEQEININKSICKAHLNAAGWGLDDYNHGEPWNSVSFYVVDFTLGHLGLLTIESSKFDTVKMAPMDELVSMTSQLVKKWHKKRIGQHDLSVLGMLLNSYLHQTKTYELWKSSEKTECSHPHFIFNLYRSKQNGNISMRPFALQTQDAFLSVEDVRSYARSIRKHDVALRPEEQVGVIDKL
ncbi:hypothetical protein [Shewanella colwelliana]|uniref:hypothetical protein n=1 Tax=Shewanella colwelliana TaxID=23 RepID=UPI0022AFBD85|nr:hypothetical protein [Shewanella colwelliana]MCZ4337629.1 hypothetical protein [Shewanella colwelliana]